MTTLARQMELDFGVLRARRDARSRSLLRRAARLVSKLPTRELFRWWFAILPLAMAWMFIARPLRWFRFSDPTDCAVSVIVLLLVEILLRAARLRGRGSRGDSLQAGLSAGSFLIAIVPAVLTVPMLLFLGLLLVAYGLGENDLDVMAGFLVFLWAPAGVAISCALDARWAFRARPLEQFRLSDFARLAVGFVLSTLITAGALFPHFGLLYSFIASTYLED